MKPMTAKPIATALHICANSKCRISHFSQKDSHQQVAPFSEGFVHLVMNWQRMFSEVERK